MSSVRFPTGGAGWQSQQLSNTERRDMKAKAGSKSYSWWWDSHNAPKNSKWLEDNLNDMDAKVKAMLKLIEEDADSFAKRAEMYYKKRPELVNLVEEFYRAYRSLAERYDQLTGHVRQIPQEIQVQYGFLGDASPGSPGSGGSVRRRAAGFSAFASPETPKHSKAKGRKDGSNVSSSSGSDTDSDSKHAKPQHSDELRHLRLDNEQLRKDLEGGIANQKALESRLAEMQGELKSLHQENVQLHRNAAAAHSEIAVLEAEIERLKRENRTLGEEHTLALRSAERLQQELEFSQKEQQRMSIRLEETYLTIQDLEARIKELEARITLRSEELISSTALCEQQSQELVGLHEEKRMLQQMVSEKITQIQELEDEIARLKAILSEAELDRNRNFELHTALEKDLANVHIEFSSMKEERGRLSGELHFKVQHVQSLEQQLIAVQETMASLEDKKEEVVMLLSNSERNLLDVHRELNETQKRMAEEISVRVSEKLVLQKQLGELQAALEALQGERSRGFELQSIFESRVADLELQLKVAHETLETCENEKTSLVTKAENRLLKMQVEFESVREKLKGGISLQAQEKQLLADQVVELNAALEASLGKQNQAAALQDVFEKRIVDLELHRKQNKEALESTERDKGELIGLLTKMENGWLRLQTEFWTVQENLKGEVSTLAEQKQSLQSRINDLEAALEALQGERGRSVELQDVLEKRLMDYEQQLKQLEAALGVVEKERADVRELLSETELNFSALQEEYNSRQTQMTGWLSVLEEEKKALNGQVEELRATLASLLSEKTRGTELHDVLEKRVLELQLELSQAKQEASALSHELLGRVEAVSQLEESIKSRDEIVSKLGKDLESSKIEATKLRDELDSKLALITRCEGEIEERENQLTALREEISSKLEERHAFQKQVDLLLEEKLILSKDNSVLLVEIERLKKELQEATRTLLERASSIVNLELQCKQFVDEFEIKQAHHMQHFQAVTSDKERVELGCAILQEANSKLEIEVAIQVQHIQQLDLDLKAAEEAATVSMKEVSKLKVHLESETDRCTRAEEKCLLQEQLVLDLKDHKARLVARVEELETRIETLQEKLEGSLAKMDQLGKEREACDMEILALNNELSKLKTLSEEASVQSTKTISELRIKINKLELDLASRTEELQSFAKEQVLWHLEKDAILESNSRAAKEKEELQSTILMWTQRTEKLEMEHMSLKASFREREFSLNFHQTEHSRVQSEVAEKLERIQWLEGELKRRELTCQGHLQKFKSKEENMESQIIKCRADIQELDDLCKELTQKLKGKDQEHEALILNREVIRETLRLTQLERDNVTVRCNSLQHELLQEHEFRVEAEAGVSRHKAESSDLMAQIARLQTQLKELMEEKQSLTRQIEELQGTLATLLCEKTQGIELHDVLEKRVLELQLELSQASQEAHALSHELEGRIEAVSELEKSLKGRDEVVSKLGVDLELSRTEGTRQRDELDDKFVLIQRLESEVEDRGNQLATLREEITTKQKEGHILGERIDLLLEEKVNLSKENFLLLIEIERLKKELLEAAGSLTERASLIVSLEMQYKRFVEESEQKQAHHVQQYQALTSDKDRVEHEHASLQDVKSKLEVEVANQIQRIQQLELDLKAAEEAATSSMMEVGKLKVELVSEIHKSKKAEEECLLRDYLVLDLKKEKAGLLARVEELEMRIKSLQEELEGSRGKMDHLCKEKESCDIEILALNHELSKVKLLSKEASVQFIETISALRIEINKLELDLGNHNEKLDSFEKERAMWHTEKGAILESISQAAKEKEELQTTILLWTQRMEKLEMEHTSLKTASGEMESSLTFHQTEYGRLQSCVAEKEEQILWLEGEVKRLELTCQEHIQKFNIKEESMKSQIVKYRAEIQDLDDLSKELTKKLEGKSREHEALKVSKQLVQEALCATELDRDHMTMKCKALQHELLQEHEFRVAAEGGVSRHTTEISALLAEIARFQTQLKELKDENNALHGKLEAALEVERTYETEIDMLLKALHTSHEGNGSSDVGDLFWHSETKLSAGGKNASIMHLKGSLLKLLTDKSTIREEVAVHVEHIKALNFEIVKSGQILQSVRGDYHALQGKHESTLAELHALVLRIEQLESQVGILGEEKSKLHDQLLSSVRDSDQLSSNLMKEKKELYEKLVIEGHNSLKVQQELKLLKEETDGNKKFIDELQKEIERLNLGIQEIALAKDQQERSLRDELELYAEEKAVLAKSLNETHGFLSTEKAEVMKLKEENDRNNELLLKLKADIFLLTATLSQKESAFTSSLDDAKQKVTDLLIQLGMLTQEKENVLSELREKVLLCSDKDEKIQKYLSQLEEAHLELEELKKHSSFVSHKYDASVAELESARLLLSSLQEENGRLGLDVLARTVSVTELTEMVSNIKKQNADLHLQLKTLQEKGLSLQQYNSSLQVETEQLKQNLESQAKKIGLLEEEIFNLREIHSKLQTDHKHMSTEKQRSLDEHRLTMSSLEKLKEELLLQRNENDHLEAELRSHYARIQELESKIAQLEKEKHAFSVEIASTIVLMADTQRKADNRKEEISRLRREVTSSNEQLQEKTERITELLSMCAALREEKGALSMELEIKIQAFGSLDASFCALKGEHLSLVDKYEFITKEAAEGANLVLKLQEEISQLSAERDAQIQILMKRKADFQMLQENFALVQDSERQLRDLLDAKVQEINKLEEELDKLKAAMRVLGEEHSQNTKRLEIELKRMELVVIGFRDEKISLSEQNALALSKCTDLEATCKSLQQQVADQQKERERLEAQFSVVEELKKKVHDDEEMVRLMQERVANKQHEIDQVQSINEDLKEITRKLESEVESLKAQIALLEKKNTRLDEELSTKASLVQVLDQSLTSLKEQKVVFEGGFAIAVGNLTVVQMEIDKLLEKILKLNDLSVTTAADLRKMEDRICKLQVTNLNLRDEISSLEKKEKSYMIAVRFMRAEFFCLAQRIKTMKEEKAELARSAAQAMETERMKNGEVLAGLHQELAFLREENKRQRTIVFDRGEEKREAIRQLCATIDYLQSKNRHLEGVINSVREKIQRRIAASRRH